MTRWPAVSLTLLAGLSLGGYLLASHLVYRLGFPLDDAWIHQSYARNLAFYGEWALIPGSPSAGSTAPLWSAVLGIGYLLRLSPLLWAFLLGWFLLAALGWLGYVGMPLLAPEIRLWNLAAGVAILFEWHLVWSAASGMETLLFALLVTAILLALVRGKPGWLIVGVLIGISAWLRPDGISLLGPAGVVALVSPRNRKAAIGSLVQLALGFVLLFGPYLAFNRGLAGAWWPNTFYAKQAEYAILLEIPFTRRLLTQLSLPLIGAGVLLAPGAAWFAWRSWHGRRWPILAGMVWWLGYIGIYAWRLPVTYQHGRYLIPAVPIFLLWGLAGQADLVREWAKRQWFRLVIRSWLLAVGLLLLAFWALGARAYGRDVAFIESEMVVVADWIASETGSGELVAVHDIGAIGYFGGQQILDLAGLVSPEVIPFIRDEARLAAYLDSEGADYLVTFPGWYPDLVSRADLLFTTTGGFGPENMAVYRWGGE